jgi:hypothetical protein
LSSTKRGFLTVKRHPDSDAADRDFFQQLRLEVERLDAGFRKQYQHRCHRKMKAVAKVAAARRLAVRLYWMLRSNTAYPEIARIEGSPR